MKDIPTTFHRRDFSAATDRFLLRTTQLLQSFSICVVGQEAMAVFFQPANHESLFRRPITVELDGISLYQTLVNVSTKTVRPKNDKPPLWLDHLLLT